MIWIFFVFCCQIEMDALRGDDFLYFGGRQQSEATLRRCTTMAVSPKFQQFFFVVVLYFLLCASTKYCAWFGCILDTEGGTRSREDEGAAVFQF
jgi:hypothetical protein